MKVAVIGAAGPLGQELVPRLAARGLTLLLAGPDPDALARRFPGLATCTMPDLAEAGRGADLLLWLYGDVAGPAPEAMPDRARATGIPRCVLTRPLGARPPAADRQDGDAQSPVETLILPAVHGAGFTGRLSVLNRLPRVLRRLVFPVLAAFVPTLDADRLAAHIAAGGVPGGILSDGQAQNRLYQGIKRLFDLVFAVAVIGLFWWGLAAIWAAIRLTSPGPGVFRQDRVGKDGQVFTCYKFRTMALGTRQAGTHDTSAAAVTRLGRILRATKLDELPQVLNILRNEISLIGPRPCLPLQQELIAERRRCGVLAVKPGISGLAQTEGIDMSAPVRLAHRDADYVALQSLGLDLRLVLATAVGGGQGDKVRPGGPSA